MQLRPFIVLLAVSAVSAPSANTNNPALEKQFTQTVKPFVVKYCIGCHSGNTPAASLDLKSYTTSDSAMDAVIRDYSRWTIVHDRLAAKEMPPKQMPQPPEEVRTQVTEWIQAVRADEIKKRAGDPGIVPARRLSNAEYDYAYLGC